MNEINIKKGDKVLVRDSDREEWRFEIFHHFFEGEVYTVREFDIKVSWKLWKLPDPPKPEKKEYWVGWYVTGFGHIFNSYKECLDSYNSTRICIFHITQEEGKLPVVEVIEV